MSVGSLVGQVTVGSRPDIHGSTLLAQGLMDRYTCLLHMQDGNSSILTLNLNSREVIIQNHLSDMFIFNTISCTDSLLFDFPFNYSVE